jgi:hypothetical protein
MRCEGPRLAVWDSPVEQQLCSFSGPLDHGPQRCMTDIEHITECGWVCCRSSHRCIAAPHVQQATGPQVRPVYRIRSCCWWPRKSSSPAGQGRGRGLGLPSVTQPARWRPLGRANSCCEPSRRGRPPAAHAALEPCYRWQPALRWLSCPAWPHRERLGGRDPRLPLDPGLFQRVHRGDQPADQKAKRLGHGLRNVAN